MALTFTVFHGCLFTSAVAFCSLAYYITSLVTTKWLTVTIFFQTMSDMDYGIFRACYNGTCMDIEDTILGNSHLGDFKAVRAMVILALLLTFFGFALTVTSTILARKERDSPSRGIKTPLFIASGTSFILSFVFSMVAVGIFQNAIYDDVDTSGNRMSTLLWSFYLCAAAGVFSEIALDLLIYTVYKFH